MVDTSLPAVAQRAVDDAWSLLDDRLDGLGPHEYLWEPAPGCWTVRDGAGGPVVDLVRPEPDPAPVTTIAWRMWHLAVDCFDSYSERSFGTTAAGLEGRRWVLGPDDARQRLRDAVHGFAAGVAGWDAAQLTSPLGGSWGPYAEHTRLDLVVHAAHELAHHGAEIALLRDLHPHLTTH